MVTTPSFQVDIGPSWELMDALVSPCSLRIYIRILIYNRGFIDRAYIPIGRQTTNTTLIEVTDI